MKTGIELIAEERERQVSQEGWTPEHDNSHVNGELRKAGIAYERAANLLLVGRPHVDVVQNVTHWWPWEQSWLKVSPDPVRNLVKAGALYKAEEQRLERTGPTSRDCHLPSLDIQIEFVAYRIDSLLEMMSNNTNNELGKLEAKANKALEKLVEHPKFFELMDDEKFQHDFKEYVAAAYSHSAAIATQQNETAIRAHEKAKVLQSKEVQNLLTLIDRNATERGYLLPREAQALASLYLSFNSAATAGEEQSNVNS